MTMENISFPITDCNLSLCNSASATATSDISLHQFLDGVRGGKWRQPVEHLRGVFNSTRQRELARGATPAQALKTAKDVCDPLKKRLPGILACGQFSQRRKDCLVQHSGLLVLDLDGLDGRVDDVKTALIAQPGIAFAFISPTGTGLKVGVRVPPDGTMHAESYQAAARHVHTLTGCTADAAAKDLARLCFVSWDADLYQHLGTEQLEVPTIGTGSGSNPDNVKDAPSPLVLTVPAKTVSNRDRFISPSTRQQIAQGLLGAITWTSNGEGLCTCPGIERHTTGDGERDCAVYLEGVPTVSCFHSSCRGAVDAVNKEFRRQVGIAEGTAGTGANTSASTTAAEPKPDTIARPWLDIEPPADGESVLIGPGPWLSRGGGLLLVGGTGTGKSTLSATLAFSFALGRPALGFEPTRPLRSLVLQAEDDDTDLAEMKRGIVGALEPTEEEMELLRGNVLLVTEKSRTGPFFLSMLPGLLERYRPDLLHINPLSAYFGADLNDQRAVAEFFRAGLNPLLDQYKCAAVCIHHCAKPSKERDGWKDGALAYVGSGSADLANWAREVLSLRQVKPGIYELAATKRWRKLGWKDSDGKATATKLIAHATDGSQVWQEAGSEVLAEHGATPYSAAALCALVPEEGIDKTELVRLVQSAFSLSERTARTYLADCARPTRHRMGDGWRKCRLLSEGTRERREVYPDKPGGRAVVWVALTEDGRSCGNR